MEQQQELTTEEVNNLVQSAKRKGVGVILSKKDKQKEEWDRLMRLTKRFRERK